MKQVVIVASAVLCLIIVVYLRRPSGSTVPELSNSSRRITPDKGSEVATVGGPDGAGGFGGNPRRSVYSPESAIERERAARWELLARMNYDFQRWQPVDSSGWESEDVHIEEIPPFAKELAETLRCFHANTLHSFEISPWFGIGREPPPVFRHSPVPDGMYAPPERQLDEELSGKLAGQHAQWIWLSQMRGITGRGFIYYSNNRRFVCKSETMVKDLVSDAFLRELKIAPRSAELREDERVFRVVNHQLVSLLLHNKPMVYEKERSLEKEFSNGVALTRELDPIESELLEKLRISGGGAVAWNHNENCLQMLGAIRAKESCMKCHEVKTGYLLGAFSYRFEEVKHP